MLMTTYLCNRHFFKIYIKHSDPKCWNSYDERFTIILYIPSNKNIKISPITITFNCSFNTTLACTFSILIHIYALQYQNQFFRILWTFRIMTLIDRWRALVEIILWTPSGKFQYVHNLHEKILVQKILLFYLSSVVGFVHTDFRLLGKWHKNSFVHFCTVCPIFSDNIDNDNIAYELNSCQKANKVLATRSIHT